MSSAKQDKSDVEKGVEKIYFEIAKKKNFEKNVDLGSMVHVNKKIRLSHWNLFCY